MDLMKLAAAVRGGTARTMLASIASAWGTQTLVALRDELEATIRERAGFMATLDDQIHERHETLQQLDGLVAERAGQLERLTAEAVSITDVLVKLDDRDTIPDEVRQAAADALGHVFPAPAPDGTDPDDDGGDADAERTRPAASSSEPLVVVHDGDDVPDEVLAAARSAASGPLTRRMAARSVPDVNGDDVGDGHESTGSRERPFA